MSTIAEALRWDGVTYIVSLFLVTESAAPPSIEFAVLGIAPEKVTIFTMESDEDPLGGRQVYEYDLMFDDLPPNLAVYLEECLRAACSAGQLAWLGFEGSFHFDDLLTDDISGSIYGVCARGGRPELALERDVRKSDHWESILAAHRHLLGLDAES